MSVSQPGPSWPLVSMLSIAPALKLLTLKCQSVRATAGELSAAPCPLRNGGFDKGRRLVRLPAIGLPLGMPASARCESPRGFPCQIRRGPGRWSRIAARVRTSAFRASRPALGPSGVKLQRRAGRGRRVGGACGPAGRLEDVQKALTGQTGDTRLRRLASSRETTHYERHATPPHMR